MTMISYAQNFEDVMLWRALKGVEKGFYIDVGANHPEIDSVTKAFYDHGWSGINVEPELELFMLLKKERPRDININAAISATVSSIDLYVSSIRGWSTTDSTSSDNLQKKDSLSEVRTVQALSLDELCAEHHVDEVHFLKVDVEGAEKDVLESFSFDKVRPWICVVEATKPTTQIDISSEWEDILFKHDYALVYFDGLNKYYVAKEHSELIDAFKVPPNVFDDFMIAGEKHALEQAALAESKASQAKNKCLQIENSFSWKITAPLRFFVRGSHWLVRRLRKEFYSYMQRFYGFFVTYKKRDLTLEAQEIYDILKKLNLNVAHEGSGSENNKLAIVTPVPPSQTGIAYYMKDLASELSKDYDLEVITASSGSIAGVQMRTVDYFKKNAHTYKTILYQIGNNKEHHLYMLDLMKRYPGVAVLHDFFLGDMLYLAAMTSFKRVGFWDKELIRSHGYSSVYQKAQHDMSWAIKKYPANAFIFNYSRAVIVHSRYAKRLCSKWYDGKYDDKLFYLPQVHTEVESTVDLVATNSEKFTVCSFGHIVEHKCYERIIEAWIEGGFNQLTNFSLVFVGSIGRDEYALRIKSMIEGVQNIRITGYLSNRDLHDWLSQADLAIQLRLQSRGETSRAVLDCMSYGIPTIVNSHASLKEFSSDAVYKVSEFFSNMELSQAIRRLSENCSQREMLSKNARLIIKNEHSPKVVTKKLVHILNKVDAGSNQQSVKGLFIKDAGQRARLDSQALLNLSKKYDLVLRQNQTPCLYVDISAIVREDLKTGIQRVVRAILISLVNMDIYSYKIVPVYLTDKGGYWHYRVANGYVGALLASFSLHYDSVIEPTKGDVFLGLDLYPGGIIGAYESGLFKRWKQRGIDINFVVYDILPVRFPSYFPPTSAEIHSSWVDSVAESADKLLSISQTIAEDVRSYLDDSGIERDRQPEIQYFHLGADITNSVPSKGLPENAALVLRQLTSKYSFLMVGSLEPRKGHGQVLAAFETLWEAGEDLNLVIVGKEGWQVEDLMNRLRNHAMLGKKLFLLESISDEYLEKIYGSSSCLIAASEGEGFGLPLIEAAQHKLPIIARDIPVFREVAGEHAYYFENSNDPDTLANAIKSWLQLYKQNKHPSSDAMPWLTWEESAKQLLKCLNIEEDKNK